MNSLRPRSSIPNTEGFKLVAVRHDGTRVAVTVAKHPDGMHYLPGLPMKELAGWLPAPSQNPGQVAFWAAVKRHSRPVDWAKIAPTRPVMNPPRV